MAHNLFGNRFYGLRKPAWHKLGFVSDTERGAVESMTAIGGGYWFEKRPVFVSLNGIQTQTKDYAIVRSALPDDPEERVFGFAGNRYVILQPLEVCEMFDEKVNQPVETLGMLGKGERMFLTWKMPSIEVVKDDKVDTYGFLAIGFDAVAGASLNIVTTRVVCQNTWMAAIREAESSKERGKGRIYSGKHTSSLKYELGEWMGYVQTEAERQVQLTSSFFKRLADTPIENENEVYRLLFAAYPDPVELSADAYIPNSLRGKKSEKIEAERESAQKNREGIYSYFNGKGTEISRDYWGLFNATTEYFNYGQVEKKPASASILMGNRATNMNAMAEVLLQNSKKG